MTRAGRPRKPGPREPNGRPKRGTEADRKAALVTPERMQHSAFAEVPTDAAGVKTLQTRHVLDLLYDAGRIDDAELDAGRTAAITLNLAAKAAGARSALGAFHEARGGGGGSVEPSDWRLFAMAKRRELVASSVPMPGLFRPS